MPRRQQRPPQPEPPARAIELLPQRFEPEADLLALSEHPDNPWQGDDDAVTSSAVANGFFGDILVQQSTGRVLSGHSRRRALLKAGVERGPVLWVDVDDATAGRILVAANRIHELGGWDDVALLEVLGMHEASGDLEATGFTADALAALAQDMSAVPDEVPDDPDPMARRKRMLESYEDNAMRQIVLVYPAAEYDQIVMALERIREATGAATYAAVVARLALEADGA